jgi:hypothetical protein
MEIITPGMKAPAFNAGPGGSYPNDGKQIGPAWAAMWALLWNAKSPIDADSLSYVAMAMLDDPPTLDTMKSLLHGAARNGLLAKGYITRKGLNRTTYVIADGIR